MLEELTSNLKWMQKSIYVAMAIKANLVVLNGDTLLRCKQPVEAVALVISVMQLLHALILSVLVMIKI